MYRRNNFAQISGFFQRSLANDFLTEWTRNVNLSFEGLLYAIFTEIVITPIQSNGDIVTVEPVLDMAMKIK